MPTSDTAAPLSNQLLLLKNPNTTVASEVQSKRKKISLHILKGQSNSASLS